MSRFEIMLMIKGLIGGMVQIALFAVFLLIPADTWYWPRAIQFLTIYGIVLLISTVVLARFAPASLEARLEPPLAKSQPLADRFITVLLVLLLPAWFVFIPVDVFHLHSFPAPGLVVSVIGAAIGFAGYGIMMVTLFQNAYAVPIVRDQPDRNQVLIDSGLYGLVRHPLYLGFLLFFIGIALWLESYAAVLALSIIFIVLMARMQIEEKTLCKKLPGYIEYMDKVRYRLIPFVW